MNGPTELHGVRHIMRQLPPKQTCEPDCAGSDDPPHCPRCHGDGRDPMSDYLLACPECGGRAAP